MDVYEPKAITAVADALTGAESVMEAIPPAGAEAVINSDLSLLCYAGVTCTVVAMSKAEWEVVVSVADHAQGAVSHKFAAIAGDERNKREKAAGKGGGSKAAGKGKAKANAPVVPMLPPPPPPAPPSAPTPSLPFPPPAPTPPTPMPMATPPIHGMPMATPPPPQQQQQQQQQPPPQ